MWKVLRGWYELNGKRTILNVLLLFLVIGFIAPMKELLEALPTNLLQINHSWQADIATLIACGFLLIWGWNFEIRSWGKLLNRLVVTAFLGYIYFVYFREVSNNRFVALYWFQKYYYFDIIIIALLSWALVPTIKLIGGLISKAIQNVIETAKQKEKKSDNLNWFWKMILWLDIKPNPKPDIKDLNSFIEDIPKDNGDELQRESYAKTLADKIVATNPKKAFNIGIFGEWGSGKSDFIHRIGKALREQDKKEVIIVEFNPWRVGSNSSITEDYLQVLSRHLRPYSSRLSNSIGDYAKQFIDKADTTVIVKSASNILTDTFMPNADIESQYEAIKNEVSYLDTTIVVFIDDLDRLNKEEILETFKLIRNVADFPNTFFVLGLDYDYVMKTAFEVNSERSFADVNKVLGDIQNKEPSQNQAQNAIKSNMKSDVDFLQIKYIEKIFQARVSLPNISPSYVSGLSYDLLDTYFKRLPLEFDHVRLKSIIQFLEDDIFLNLNLRNIKQISNSFDVKIKYLITRKVKLDYLDLLILTIIECLNYAAYIKILTKQYFIYLTEIQSSLSKELNNPLKSDNEFKETLTKVQNRIFKDQINSDSCFKFINECILKVNLNHSYSFSNPFMFYTYTSLSSYSNIDFVELIQLLDPFYNKEKVFEFYHKNVKKFINEETFKSSLLTYFQSDFNAFFNKNNKILFLKSCILLADYKYKNYQIAYYIMPYIGLKYNQSDPEMLSRIMDFFDEYDKLINSDFNVIMLECFPHFILDFLGKRFIEYYGLANEVF